MYNFKHQQVHRKLKMQPLIVRAIGKCSSFIRSNSTFVRVVEVGPRDGLQNESVHVPTEKKIEFIDRLSHTGLKSIEATSFVSPKWIPQLADNAEVFTKIQKNRNVSHSVLVPNLKGLKAAHAVGVKEVAIMCSASEGFARKNINCSIDESLDRVRVITEYAHKHQIQVRGYLSCVVGCPYDGYVTATQVTRIVVALLEFGCYEVSLADTIGIGTRGTIETLLRQLLQTVNVDRLAIHCHDTYGQALPNICLALDLGVNVVDAAVAGLGGCPYAPGASGNVATEDVVYMLHGCGVQTGVDLEKLILAGRYICDILNKEPVSKVNHALHRKYQMMKNADN